MMTRHDFPALRRWALPALLAGLAASPIQASAEELLQSNLGTPPGWAGWDRMTVTAPRHLSASKTLQIPSFLLDIWAKEIAENDDKYRQEGNADLIKNGHAPAEALYSVYREGAVTVVVSLLNTAKACEDGPNDAASQQIHSVCPVRVTVQQGGSAKSVDWPGACFLDPTYGNPPGGPDPKANATLTRYDRQAGRVDLVSLRDNRSLPGCAKQLQVPPL